MPAPNPNGHSTNGSSETAVTREGGPSLGELFTEGEELRNLRFRMPQLACHACSTA